MPGPDYYELLDVEPTVPQSVLKSAYYRQARIYHPDRNPGNPAAEERFKLIAEAYRVLGDERERRLYDEARERETRYADAPELAGMKRRVRFSVRRGRAGDKRRSGIRRRFTILPARKKMPRWVVWGLVAFWMSALLPLLLSSGGVALKLGKAPQKVKKTEPSAEVVRERLARVHAELEQKAAAGEPIAQLRLGLMLYSGSAGVPMNRPAAQIWWQKAAAQGNKTALYYLEKCDFSQPVPDVGEAAEAAEAP
jgi:curved DNA-binding protein CbpA